MKKDNIANKHHYVPRFYLKAWANNNGKLVQWSVIPHGNKIMSKFKVPSATAFEHNLYALDGSDKAEDHIVFLE